MHVVQFSSKLYFFPSIYPYQMFTMIMLLRIITTIDIDMLLVTCLFDCDLKERNVPEHPLIYISYILLLSYSGIYINYIK